MRFGLLVCLLFLASPAFAQFDTIGRCAKPYDADNLIDVLVIKSDNGAILDVLGLYDEDCTGSIFALDLKSNEFAIVVNESWRYFHLGEVTVIDQDTIDVEAEFATGIGPEGAKPFWAVHRLTRGPDGWISEYRE